MDDFQQPAVDLMITPIKRSLVRRVLPWAASLGLFAGGGFGVYRYAAPHAAKAAAEDSAAATASDLTGTFASSSAPRTNPFAASASSVTPASYADRYARPSASTALTNAPSLPPTREEQEVDTPRSAAALSNGAGPLATTPVSALGDRYASATPSADPFAPPAVAAKAPAEKAAAAATAAESGEEKTPATVAAELPPDVARGQEPDANMLRNPGGRSAAPINVGPADEARAAFSDQLPSTKPLNLVGAPRTASAADAKSTAATQAPLAAGRYASPAQHDQLAARNFQDEATDGPTAAAPLATKSASSPIASNASPPAAAAAAAVQSAKRPAAPDFGYGAQPPLVATRDDAQPLPAPAAPAGAGAAAKLGSDAPDDNGAVTPTPGIAAADGTGRPGERILEGVQSPTLTLQKLAPPEIQVGKKCTFAIRVTNGSQRAAHNVEVHDEVPLGTQLVGAAPKATVNGTQVSWDLGTLSAGEERVVEMELIPTDEGELGSVATVTFAAQASAKARCTRPQLALRLTAKPRVMIGEQQLVEIEVSNPGSGDATGIILTESVPQGVSHEAGPALEFEVGTLKPGESRRLELVLHAEHAGQVKNVMTAKADANLQVQAGCDFEVIAPDLKVSVEGPQKRYLERPATYTVNVDNPGTASAKDIQLVTQLPRGMQFVSANNMGEYDAATHSVYWSLAELPANERGSVELTALPIEPGEHTLQVASRASQGLEDRAETRVSVEGLVALSFEVTSVDAAVPVGGDASYEVRVSNQGSKAATNVQLIAIMPPGLKPMAGQGETRQVVEGNRVSFAPLAQLAPKSEAKFRIQVQGLRPGDQRVRVQVKSDEMQEPITKEESTRVYADE